MGALGLDDERARTERGCVEGSHRYPEDDEAAEKIDRDDLEPAGGGFGPDDFAARPRGEGPYPVSAVEAAVPHPPLTVYGPARFATDLDCDADFDFDFALDFDATLAFGPDLASGKSTGSICEARRRILRPLPRRNSL